MASTAPAIFISAGEASGEHYGALLAAELRRQLAARGLKADLFGMGGPRMESAGVERVVRAEDMAVMGFTEVVLHLPRIYREFRKLKRAIRARRPGVAVLIDFPEIHFRLAKELHRLGVPVIYFVSPQLWAWKQRRIRLVREYVRRMLVIFPFEEAYYRDRGVNAKFVGHPLADLPLPAITRGQFAAGNRLDPAKTWIGVLPGSRMKEIEANLPEMLEAARRLTASEVSSADPQSGFDYLIPLAPTLDAAQRAAVARLAQNLGGGMAVRLVDDARAALHHARASIVASGTATVEAALIGNPFVVVYRVSPLTFAIAKTLVKVPHVAMVNLIAGRRVVPELIQHDFTAANIVQHLSPLLPDGPARESMRRDLGAIREALRVQSANGPGEAQGAIERVAAVVAHELEGTHPAALEAARP
ncbi:MAG: lipid-A-disaccharide synthase [Terracidiphilus sp.]|jgi:lipid-A-disaccharide synthase